MTDRPLTSTGLTMPPDFPVEPYEAILDTLRKQDYPVPEAWGEFASGWNALSWRYAAVAENDEAFALSVNVDSASPEPPGRYRQEDQLFSFFVAGHSALEAFAYGAWAMLWATGDGQFDLSTPNGRRVVSLVSLHARLTRRYTDAAVTGVLGGILMSSEFRDWVALRNALAHRGSPPRLHRASIGGPRPPRPTDWGDMPLDDQTTAVRRAWLAESLSGLLSAAEFFAQDHLNRR